jgi:hypothetical protein
MSECARKSLAIKPKQGAGIHQRDCHNMKRQLCQDQPQLVALLLPAALYALHPHNVTALLNEDSSLECPCTLQSQAIQVTCFEQSARWA